MKSPAYFVDTTGEPTLGVGLCGRCSAKLPLAELSSDPNSPGLMVCKDDLDVLDPWRLPARETEDINLPFVRPDVSIHDGAPYGSVPGINDSPLPVFDVLARRLVTESGQPILTESGQYIDIDVAPGPLDLP
jgi:hypothetical protein